MSGTCRHEWWGYDAGKPRCLACNAPGHMTFGEPTERAQTRGELNAMHAYADLLEGYIGRVHALLDSVQRGPRPDSHAEPYTRGMAQGIFVLAQRIRINLPDPRREERNR